MGQDFILGPESRQRYDAGQGQGTDGVDGKGGFHPRSQTTHGAHVLGVKGNILMLVTLTAMLV